MKIRFKKALILTGAIAATILVVTIIWLVIWLNWHPTDLENRALVILFESNGSLIDEDLQFYYNHKKLADFFLTTFLGIKKTELEDNDILQVLDSSIDDKMSKIMKRFAKGYGKIVVLTQETASFDSFVQELRQLDQEGYIIDIVTHFHGNDNMLYFKSEMVSGDVLLKTLGKLNLGFVYQVNCYGKSNLKTWLQLGTKAVSGSEGVNSMVIIAPSLVIRSMVWGESFTEAVTNAYKFEIGFWKIAKVFVPEIFWTDKDSLEVSKPFVAGESNYKIEKAF